MDITYVLLDTIIKHSEDAIIICDDTGRISDVNPSFVTLMGYEWKSLQGILLFGEEGDKNSGALFETKSVLDSSDKCIMRQITTRCSSGEAFVLTTKTYMIQSATGQTKKQLTIIRTRLGSSATQTDAKITDTHFDSLTKLPDATLFKDRLEQTIVVASRAKKSIAVLTIGLDRFTLINDALGYEFADKVLKAVAERFAHSVRKSDTIARASGDRFAIIMVITTLNDSVLVAEKILKAMSEPLIIDTREIAITASIGISLYPGDGQDSDSLIKRSESAMYHAKKSGGNCYRFIASDMNEKARIRIDMDHSLKRALDREEFVLYYQPKVDINTSAIVGAEALIRWQHPERGIIAPREFIPIAEENSLIVPIGTWVLNTACRQAVQWKHLGIRPVRISVNVTGQQLKKHLIVEDVKAALASTGLNPSLLELEITESMLMVNPEEVIGILTDFRNINVHVSIDDFGTGYSSLSYLSRFPITTLKIDRAFIKDIQTNHNNAEITRAIIGLSRSLKLEVVAEGAEIHEQIEFLREHGCVTVQGFFYSRPVTACDFEKLLQTGFIHKSKDRDAK